MADWILSCPNCGTNNVIRKADIMTECGKVKCRCTCENCSTDFEGEDSYWKYLDLIENPLELETFDD
jgi:hypothetical protein